MLKDISLWKNNTLKTSKTKNKNFWSWTWTSEAKGKIVTTHKDKDVVQSSE